MPVYCCPFPLATPGGLHTGHAGASVVQTGHSVCGDGARSLECGHQVNQIWAGQSYVGALVGVCQCVRDLSTIDLFQRDSVIGRTALYVPPWLG